MVQFFQVCFLLANGNWMLRERTVRYHLLSTFVHFQYLWPVHIVFMYGHLVGTLMTETGITRSVSSVLTEASEK